MNPNPPDGTFTTEEWDRFLAGQDKPFNAIATPKPWFDFWIKELYGIEPGTAEYEEISQKLGAKLITAEELEELDRRLQT